MQVETSVSEELHWMESSFLVYFSCFEARSSGKN
jgi:hypothetical protein